MILYFRGMATGPLIFSVTFAKPSLYLTDAALIFSGARLQKKHHPPYRTIFRQQRGILSESNGVDHVNMTNDTRRHLVTGVECEEVSIYIPSLGPVVVLEATAESQEVLVNMALEVNSKTEEAGHSKTPQPTITKLNAGDPYGAVLWPAAYAIATKIVNSEPYKTELPNLSVLELGAGTGLVSLAVSIAGAKEVTASDYEVIPLRLLEYAALNLNQQSGSQNKDKQLAIKYQLLDMRDCDTPLPPADLVVAADILYEPKTGRAMAKRAVEALKRGSRVLVADSPGRPGRNAFLQELKRLGVANASFTDTVGYTCTGPRHDLICGQGSTSISKTPQKLAVAIMELGPDSLCPRGIQ